MVSLNSRTVTKTIDKQDSVNLSLNSKYKGVKKQFSPINVIPSQEEKYFQTMKVLKFIRLSLI